MFKLLTYFKKYRIQAVLGPLFKLLEASFELIIPLIVAAIIDKGIGNADRPYIVKMCLVMAALGLLGFISSITAQYFAARTAVGFITNIRSVLFEKIQTLSYTSLDKIGKSTLVNRMTSDTNQLQTSVNLTLRLLLRSPFIVFGAMIMAYRINREAGDVFLVAIVILSVIVFGIMLITMPKYKRVQRSLDDITSITAQNLEGVRVIRAFCCEEEQTAKFVEKNNTLYKIQKGVAKISALMNPLTLLVINFAVITLIYTGSKQVDSGVITQGSLVALYNYMAQILVELIKLASLIITVTKGTASASRISTLLAVGGEENPVNAVDINTVDEIRFENVTFKYEGAGGEALVDISFTAQKGNVIGVIGATGSGKTTLINLLPKFYEPTAGNIFINGKNTKNINKESIRKNIAIAAQYPSLFKGTIAENLILVRPHASEEEMLIALEKAQAKNLEKSSDALLKKFIEQDGKNLSGGQKQRVSIARALLCKTEVLVLDDSSSALDNQTDARLRAALAVEGDKMMIFIVSQRVNSIINADKILVLDNGECVGIGTHNELLSQCEVYQKIFALQTQGA